MSPPNRPAAELPDALERWPDIAVTLGGRRPAVFLDYDGTLTPIVARPEQAELAPEVRAAVALLAGRCPVAVVSGRDRQDVARRVGVDGLVYAGSHGLDIAGTDLGFEQPAAVAALPALGAAAAALERSLATVAGAQVERKRFAISVHYRNVDETEVPRVRRAVAAELARHHELRGASGKKVLELRPDVDWDKGHAVRWVVDALGRPRHPAFYLGDDLTDEDAFRALYRDEIGIYVGADARPSAARYRLDGPAAVLALLERLRSSLAAS